jgi:hypothetical protein
LLRINSVEGKGWTLRGELGAEEKDGGRDKDEDDDHLAGVIQDQLTPQYIDWVIEGQTEAEASRD